jgi:segregation and condensation protein B
MDEFNEELKNDPEKEDNETQEEDELNELTIEKPEEVVSESNEVQNSDDDLDSNLSDTVEIDKEMIARQVEDYHKNLIEASLYVSGRPLSIEELNTRLEIPKKQVEELINELAFEYLERSTALVINQVGEDYQMALKTEFIEKVSKFAKGGAIAERYLRTLTVIALKQPILKSLVIKLRGSGAYEHIKYLLDNALISAVKKGRSHELTTTDKYAEMFGLPKNKEEMKRIMITQLGLDSISSNDNNENEENSN